MDKADKNLNNLANTAIEALKLAFQENPKSQAKWLILAALASVMEIRDELPYENGACDPSEYCAPI